MFVLLKCSTVFQFMSMVRLCVRILHCLVVLALLRWCSLRGKGLLRWSGFPGLFWEVLPSAGEHIKREETISQGCVRQPEIQFQLSPLKEQDAARDVNCYLHLTCGSPDRVPGVWMHVLDVRT